MDLVQGVDHIYDSDCDDQTANADYGLVNFPRDLEATFEMKITNNLKDFSFEIPSKNTLIHEDIFESNEAQSAQRNTNAHERTMNELWVRKSPTAASAAVTSADSPHVGAKINALGSLATTTSNLEPRHENLATIKH